MFVCGRLGGEAASVANGGPMEKRQRHATLLALAASACPSLNGRCAQKLTVAVEAAGSAGVLAEGLSFTETDVESWLDEARHKVSPADVEHWAADLQRLEGRGIRLLSAADPEYPVNLRMIHDRPPLLFVRGDLTEADNRAIAIVGTREASSEGLAAAADLSRGMVEAGITVVSGLAGGIDTSAHTAALESGGRTVAVFGTGIERIFPASNRELAERIIDQGALVSQFLPDQKGARWSFPVRNVVTSGLSLATVVVEAGETSGARIQAEQAVAHGKAVYLLERVVSQRQWAQDMVAAGTVSAATSVGEIIESVQADLEVELEAVF